MSERCDKTVDAFDFEAPELAAGVLHERHFELLVELTSMRSQETVAALKSHLVDGMAKSAACKKHGADKTIFSRRLAALKTIHRVTQEIKIYHLK